MKNQHLTLTVTTILSVATAVVAATDVQVNSDAAGDVQNEVRIAVDPGNSNNIVTAYNDRIGNFPNTLGVSFSTDGGVTWADRQLSSPMIPDPSLGAPPGAMITLDDIFDPFAAYDPLGNAYAGYIGRPSTGALMTNPPSGLFIELSTDGGSTWSGPTTISTDPGGAFVPPGPVVPMSLPVFNDRPDIDTGTSGEVVVTWIKDVNANTPTSDIYYVESAAPGVGMPGNPTGLNFSAQVIVNDNSEYLAGMIPLAGADRGIAPDVAIHSTGKTYVAWADYDVTITDDTSGSIKIDSTTFGSGGAGFGMDVTVATMDPLPRMLSSVTGVGSGDDARGQSYPSVAVDPTDATGNTVFLTYATEGALGDEGNIIYTRSTDGGATWPISFQINDDTTTNDQMHPNISVKSDGTIDIVWYDKRNAVNDDMWDVYIARSTDGGLTFSPNLRVTDASFGTTTRIDGVTPWIGEYLGIDTDATDAFVAFTSGTNDGFGDVFFDRIPNSSIPEPMAASSLLALMAGCFGVRRGRCSD